MNHDVNLSRDSDTTPVKVAIARNLVEALNSSSNRSHVLFGNSGLIAYPDGKSPIFYFHLEEGETDSFKGYEGKLIQSLPIELVGSSRTEELERFLLHYNADHSQANSFLLTSRDQDPQFYNILDFGSKFVSPNSYEIVDASEIPQTHLDSIFREHRNLVRS